MQLKRHFFQSSNRGSAKFAFDAGGRCHGALTCAVFKSGPYSLRTFALQESTHMKSNSRRWMGVLIVAAIAATAAGQVMTSRADEGDDELVLAFSTMRGNLPHLNINGNVGPGTPWVIGDGDGRLTDEGELNIRVRGLVLANSVPKVGGTNPVPFFRAIVSCTTVDATGATEIVNIATGGFPADAQGNCRIDADVTLPNPCYAPIVLVGPAPQNAVPGTITGGTWFAATGI
jgi:hypothetical protein